MNPGTVLGQSIAAGIALSALALLGEPVFAAGVAGAVLAWALFLNAAYAKRLGTRGRTKRRRRGDSAIARQLALSGSLPLLVALGLLALSWDGAGAAGPFSAAEIQGLVAVLAVMLAFWLASSHVDWYYIRPRIDGVITEPPCRTSRTTRWKGVTRNWYIHRAIASLVTMGTVVGVALITTLMLDREWPGGLSALGGFAAIVSVGLWLMRDEIRAAGPTIAAIRTPRYWVGDDLYYETDMWRRRGYVLHVAIPQTKLVPLDRETGARIPKRTFVEEPATRGALRAHAVQWLPR
jgi:hypothetical protein